MPKLGSVLWQREIDAKGELRVSSLAIDAESADMALSLAGSAGSTDTLRYLDASAEQLWAKPDRGPVWMERDGAVNSAGHRYSRQGKQLAEYEGVGAFARVAVGPHDEIAVDGVSKLSKEREILWSHMLELQFGSHVDSFLTVDADAQVYVHWQGRSSQVCQTSDQLRKFDPDGGEIWTRCLRDDDRSTVFAPFGVTRDGDVLLVRGRFASGGSAEAPASVELSLQRLSESGEVRWTRPLETVFAPQASYEPGSRVQVVEAVAIGAHGDVFVAGSLLGRTPEVSDDVWVAAYDGEAHRKWFTTLTSQPGRAEHAVALAVDDTGEGGVVVAADVAEGEPYAGRGRVLLAKLAQ